MQRFYKNYLSGVPVVREIPLTNLGHLVDALEQLAGLAGERPDAAGTATLVAQAFTAHDDLDGALVGAEDALAGLSDRFDLDDDRAAELKGLLVDYATHVAVELRRGSARAARALDLLTEDFGVLAAATVEDSSARDLIARGALTASKGGRVGDWLGLGVTRRVAVRSASPCGSCALSQGCMRTCAGCTPRPARLRPGPGRWPSRGHAP